MGFLNFLHQGAGSSMFFFDLLFSPFRDFIAVL